MNIIKFIVVFVVVTFIIVIVSVLVQIPRAVEHAHDPIVNMDSTTINNTAYKVWINYSDPSGCTSNVLFTVRYRNGNPIYTHNNIVVGTNTIHDEYTLIKTARGTEVIWNYNATRVC